MRRGQRDDRRRKAKEGKSTSLTPPRWHTMTRQGPENIAGTEGKDSIAVAADRHVADGGY